MKQKQTRDIITNEPQAVLLIGVDKMSTYQEYNSILKGLQDKFLTVKDIRELFFDESSKSYSKGLKTIYRHIEKLQEDGFIIEAGQRMTEGRRSVETLYCRSARAFFYDDPDLIDQWKTPTGKTRIEFMRHMVEVQINKKLDKNIFMEFALDYLAKQDTISTEMLKIIQKNKDLLDDVKTLSPHKMKDAIFTSTALSMFWTAKFDE